MTHLIAHILRTLERVTRPPRMGHDVDVVHDGADQLAEREAEEEVSEPVGDDLAAAWRSGEIRVTQCDVCDETQETCPAPSAAGDPSHSAINWAADMFPQFRGSK